MCFFGGGGTPQIFQLMNVFPTAYRNRQFPIISKRSSMLLLLSPEAYTVNVLVDCHFLSLQGIPFVHQVNSVDQTTLRT